MDSRFLFRLISDDGVVRRLATNYIANWLLNTPIVVKAMGRDTLSVEFHCSVVNSRDASPDPP
jgi:hypothetical protein